MPMTDDLGILGASSAAPAAPPAVKPLATPARPKKQMADDLGVLTPADPLKQALRAGQNPVEAAIQAGALPDPNKLVTPPAPAIPPTKSALLGGPEAELTRTPGPVVTDIEKYAVPAAAFAGGTALSGPLGGALAATGADYVTGYLNQLIYGTPSPKLTPKNIGGDVASNVVGAAVGEGLGAVGGGALNRLLGKPQLIAAAKEAAEAGTGEAEEFARAGEDAEAKAAAERDKLNTQTAQKLAPEARTAAIQESLGRTPEQTQQAIAGGELEKTAGGAALPGPAMVGRQQGFWKSVLDPIHRMSGAAGEQYDRLWAPHLKDSVDATSLGSAVDEEAAYASQQGITYSPPVQKLLDRAKQLATGPDILSKYYSEEDLTGLTPMQRSNLEAGTRKMLAEGQARLATTSRQTIYKPGEAPVEAAAEPTGPSIAKLRGLRTDASNLVASSASGRDKAAAQNVVEAVDRTLDTSNVLSPAEQKALQGLNAKYRTYRTVIPRSLLRKVGGSAEPVDAAGEIFDDPKRSRLLLANADQDQVSNLRRTYADWVNRDGAKVIKPEHQVALQRMFPGTKLADPKSFIHLDKSLTSFQDVINSSPQVRQRFIAERAQAAAEIADKANATIVKEATTQASKMGNVGKQIITQMRAAKTNEEKVDIATKAFTGMDTQLAVQSIMNGKVKGNPAFGWLTRRWPLYAAAAGLGYLSGHTPSTFISIMAGMGGISAGVEGLRSMYLASLADNPEGAQALWNAATNYGTPANFRSLAALSAKGEIAALTAHGRRAATGVDITQPSAPEATPSPTEAATKSGPGPGVKAADRFRAEAIAPSRASADSAEKLAMNLSKPTPVDISNDLASGRHSIDEVKKTLQFASDPRLSNLLAGIPIQDGMHSVEVASPQEKEVLLPILQNRLRQEMPQIKNQTMQSNLAQRLRQLQTPPAADDATAIV